jgi:hypothetical protein
MATGAANVARLQPSSTGTRPEPLCPADLYIIRVTDVTAPFLPNSDDSTRQIIISTVTKRPSDEYVVVHTRAQSSQVILAGIGQFARTPHSPDDRMTLGAVRYRPHRGTGHLLCARALVHRSGLRIEANRRLSDNARTT